MTGQHSFSPELIINALSKPVIPLPIKLYESKGVIFELYDGGQPHHPMTIRWEQLESIEGMKSALPDLHRTLEDNI